jgi:hypothetical protein
MLYLMGIGRNTPRSIVSTGQLLPNVVYLIDSTSESPWYPKVFHAAN